VTAPGEAAALHFSPLPLDGVAEDDALPVTPFPSAPIEEMLRVFVKGVRAHQLYLHNNPTYLRALETLRTAFTPIWEHTDDFALQVTESDLVWEGVSVLHEPGKTADSLPWLFYKDGVRELRLQKGFEQEDLVGLLDIIQRARRQAPDEDDLLVMLWERDLLYLRYKYVELAEDGGLGVGDLTAHPEPHAIQPPRPDDPVRPEEQLLESRPGLVNLADFDTTLYFLDDVEVAYLRKEVETEYALDLRQNVMGILLDIFETQDDKSVRDEIATVLDLLIVHFLSARELRAVAYLLQESETALGRTTNLVSEQRARMAQLPDRLSQADALSQLLESLDQSVHLPPVEDLTALFEELRPRALETVFAWLPKIQDPSVRELLQSAATRLTAANTSELVRLIGSANPTVAIEAIRRAGAVRSPAAVTPLVRRLADAEAAMRLAAVLALAEIASAGALQGLERAIDDADRDVRVAAARALSTRGYRPALPRFEAAVKAKTLRDADLTEKMAMFEAYGVMCGDAGVPLLDGILNSRGFLGKREDSEARACAAMALGRIGSEAALTSLRRAGNEKDVVVRNAVNKALRGVTT
jgi:HEAT repeat protein